jgi:Sec-independent protein secretion pathway component TatC
LCMLYETGIFVARFVTRPAQEQSEPGELS